MTWWEILIIIAAAAFVAAVIAVSVWRKLHGKNGCGCDCGSCSGCPSCKQAQEKPKK